MFDAYGNHVRQGSDLSLDMDGFHFQHKINKIQVGPVTVLLLILSIVFPSHVPTSTNSVCICQFF